MINVCKGSNVAFTFVIPSGENVPQSSYDNDLPHGWSNCAVIHSAPNGYCKTEMDLAIVNSTIIPGTGDEPDVYIDGSIKVTLLMNIAGINVISFADYISEYFQLENPMEFLKIKDIKVKVVDTVNVASATIPSDKVS